jgi:hypothetical protein
MMFLVCIEWFNIDDSEPCVITETREKAEKYINEQLEGKKYSGMGHHVIKEIPLYA